jgi:ionotropic glutamate receptor
MCRILQLINQRKLEEMKTNWWLRDKLDCPDPDDESDGISIKNIGGVFLVIAIGAALSLVMLAFECYWLVTLTTARTTTIMAD